MAGEKQLEQRLRMKLSRDKATYQTQLSRKGTALRISTDPNESAERRAEAKKDYERLTEEIEDLKNSIAATQRNINKEKARKSLEEFDPEEGKKRADVLKEKYALLEQAYKIDNDPSIKKQMDELVKDYKDISGSVSGRPISLVAARSALTGAAPTFGTPTTKGEVAPTPAPTLAPKPKVAEGGTTGGITGGITGGATGGATGNIKPIAGAGKAVPSNFNVGSFRAADEASMRNAGGITPTGVGAGSPLDTLLAKTEFWYDLPDYIFKVDDKIGKILIEAVNNDWSKEKFMAKVRLTPWWQKNSEIIGKKIINRAKYDELKAAGEDVKNTEYGQFLSKQIRSVKADAQKLAGITLTDEQAQSVAQKIYDGNLEEDPLAINALIVPFIGKTTSIVGNGLSTTGFGGQALLNYQALQELAKRNGFTVKDILPNISAVTAGGDLETAVLRGLADGTLDLNRIAQDARMLAAQGQPQYVRDLLNQGYDLEGIYAPYRTQMARELDLNPDQIDLNDPTLRSAITDKGDMNIYDFKKALRKDSRWQYSSAANEEVSNSVLGILKDFGFQG